MLVYISSLGSFCVFIGLVTPAALCFSQPICRFVGPIHHYQPTPHCLQTHMIPFLLSQLFYRGYPPFLAWQIFLCFFEFEFELLLPKSFRLHQLTHQVRLHYLFFFPRKFSASWFCL
ncbi:hypothetical protein ACB092_05G156000 [Castanea dentata]